MASLVSAPSPANASDHATKQVATEQELASPVGRIPAKFLVRMGKAATVGYGINWTTLAIIGSFHVGALAAFFFFSWQRLAVMAILYVLAINVGIGMCYHRLLTHRGYQTPKWVEYVMSIFATMSLEGGPIFWVSTHRVHHQLSDQEGDPHTPREGGWWAHTGWILFGEALHGQVEILKRYSPDLSRDKFYLWLSKYHWLPITVSGLLLLAGGWLWGGWVYGAWRCASPSACMPPGW
jgi:stearoyl-CoA desaturase (delta-9 desaturase)